MNQKHYFVLIYKKNLSAENGRIGRKSEIYFINLIYQMIYSVGLEAKSFVLEDMYQK